MAMSPRLLRPIASGVHPEANAWRTAVVANGGSVSASTMKAVSTFCGAIDKASIRDRFYRLNLFCGTGLNAVLVPLYRGQSRTGTQYGNTTETNNGPFVSGDYVETGASGGLLGNASTKFLNTGLAQSTIGQAGHISGYHNLSSVTPQSTLIGAANDAANQRYWIVTNTSDTWNVIAYGSNSAIVFAGSDRVAIAPGLVAVTRISATSAYTYLNSAAGGENTNSVVGIDTTNKFGVFAAINSSDARLTGAFGGRIKGYSIGLGISPSQYTLFYNAMQTFQTALGRQH